MKMAVGLFAIAFIISTVCIAPFIRDKSNKEEIGRLRSETSVEKDTKQEIRTFLESISPLILDKIDAREKVIGVWLGNRGENKLLDLSEHPDFVDFMSVKKGSSIWVMTAQGTGKTEHKGLIWGAGQSGTMSDYYLYPKDALVK